MEIQPGNYSTDFLADMAFGQAVLTHPFRKTMTMAKIANVEEHVVQEKQSSDP